MKKFAITGMLLCALGASAQGPPPFGAEVGPGRAGMFGFGTGLRLGKVVTGAPYSGTLTNQVTQTLSDGNTIQRTTTAQVARDGAGRTYEQLTVQGGPFAQNGPVTLTFISDPVAGYAYVLNPNTKIATRRAIKTPANSSGAVRDAFGNRRTQTGGADANRTETDLGTQVINGVSAQGKSVTHTIPAGTIGNAQPIVSTGETWYSPDLQMLVMAKRNDPRVGSSTFNLTNINRSEPAGTLFQIPSDYTVQDAKGPGGMFPGPRRPR
jgi:hypothetical protein